jgi:hypothetical protein
MYCEVTVLFGSILIDLVGPMIVSYLLVFEFLAVILEAAVIYLLLEKRVAKAFVSSFSANLVTGLLNVVYLFIFWIDFSAYPQRIIVLAVALLINIPVETLILRFFYRSTDIKKILKVSAIMNLASYAILTFFI